MIDHDGLFKELLTTFFREFVELFLPEAAAYMDLSCVEFLDKEIFSDIAGGRASEADLIARVRFRDKPAYLVVHLEHQARAEPDFGMRMFLYFAGLFRKLDLPVYPVVLFSHDRPRTQEIGQFEVSFPDKTVLKFEYSVIQLNKLNWRDFLRYDNPLACALMAKMQVAPKDRVQVKLECLRLLAT